MTDFQDFDSLLEDMQERQENISLALYILSNPDECITDEESYDEESAFHQEWAQNILRNHGKYIPDN